MNLIGNNGVKNINGSISKPGHIVMLYVKLRKSGKPYRQDILFYVIAVSVPSFTVP